MSVEVQLLKGQCLEKRKDLIMRSVKLNQKKQRKKFLLRESNIRRINRNARKQKLSKNAYLISVINEYLEFVSRNNLLVYEYRKDS